MDERRDDFEFRPLPEDADAGLPAPPPLPSEQPVEPLAEPPALPVKQPPAPPAAAADPEPAPPVPEPVPVEPTPVEPPHEEPLPMPPATSLLLTDDVVPEPEKVPFWKREIALGGKPKADKPKKAKKVKEPKAEKPKKERKQKEKQVKEPRSGRRFGRKPKDETPGEKPAKAPFWKRELSLKRKPKEKRDEAPAEKIAKKPLWKRELSLKRKPKAERTPKERKSLRKRRGKKIPGTAKPHRSLRMRKKRIVGLKIGGSQLAAAQVVNNGVPELVRTARGPLEAGIVVSGEVREPEALANALKDFFRRNKLPRTGVRLGISTNRIGVRTFDVVGIEDAKQLANAIRFRAQETLPIPIEEAVLDYQVLSEKVDEEGVTTHRVLLVVAYRDLVDRYVTAFRKAGVKLAGIDLEAFAVLRALTPPRAAEAGPASAATVGVSIGHDRSTFAVTDGRVCESTRVLEWGGASLNVALAQALDLTPSQVEPIKRAISLADANTIPAGLTAEQSVSARDAVLREIHNFARELVSSLHFYQNQPGSLGIGEILVTGGTTHLPGLAAELQRLIGVTVRVGDPLGRVKLGKRVDDEDQIGSLAVAIGLGIED